MTDKELHEVWREAVLDWVTSGNSEPMQVNAFHYREFGVNERVFFWYYYEKENEQ